MENIVRNHIADLEIARYYKNEFDLYTLHEKLLRIFGNHKIAVPYLYEVGRIIKREVKEGYFENV
jgi:hypothetical protein